MENVYESKMEPTKVQVDLQNNLSTEKMIFFSKEALAFSEAKTK